MKSFCYSLTLLTIIFFYGCKPDIVPPAETMFLLSKVYRMPYKPIDTPYVSEEIKYNAFNKPWISVTFNSRHDTMNVFKYFYDSQNIFVALHSWYGATNYNPTTEHYYYDAQERISHIEENRSVGRVLRTFTYSHDTIVENYQFFNAGTSFNVYYKVDQKGNYLKMWGRPVRGYPYVYEYGGFDNAQNAYFMGLKPGVSMNATRASRNNPSWMRWTDEGRPVEYMQIINTYNQDSLVILQQLWAYTDSFQYIKVLKNN
ncbi:hypothetical protein [Chitinophaga nivalis]|uniref:DUF4136 domain-containing protein n=1 Tax=Chitinophaga nivalis TaxID=2991709 RepID=A0ABT3IES2_9BACT|nr:hypothetical protein [Chitinophaga nivalis]MCW3467848.1 hypothetical protein [Chitinophaga nivalis]MCW3482460.1 hypothetical protein [Chitinophaga nivalis]